jgi:hypothetical protein
MDAVVTRPGEVYREEMNSFWGWFAVTLFFGITILMLVLFIIQRVSGPIGSDPDPDWIYIALSVFYFVLGILIFNFRKLTISANTEGITAAYGMIRYFVPWSNIAGVEREERSTIRHYGGWGIRLGFKEGGSVVVYNVMNAALLLLRLKQGKRKFFGFSTKHPDEVMALVNSWKR